MGFGKGWREENGVGRLTGRLGGAACEEAGTARLRGEGEVGEKICFEERNGADRLLNLESLREGSRGSSMRRGACVCKGKFSPEGSCAQNWSGEEKKIEERKNRKK